MTQRISVEPLKLLTPNSKLRTSRSMPKCAFVENMHNTLIINTNNIHKNFNSTVEPIPIFILLHEN